MHTCPSCKSAVPQASGPCPRCGKPFAAPAGDGWDDDDGSDSLSGGLDLSRGGSMAAGAGGPSAYSGGGLSLGDDDDPFAEDAPGGSLELDVPSHHTAQSSRSMPAGGNPSGQPPPSHPNPNSNPNPGGGMIPDLVMPPPPSSRSGLSSGMPGAPPPSQPSGPSLPVPMAPPSSPRSDPSGAFGHQQSHPQLYDQPPPSQQEVAHQQPQQPPPRPPPPPPDPAALIARFPTPPQKVWEAPLYAIRVSLRQLELRQDLAALKKKRSPDVALYERALKTHDAKTYMVGLAITGAAIFLASFIFFLPVILRFLRAPD